MSHDEGRISPILCPKLKYLLIEGWGPTEPVELIPVLKRIVTHRAVCGFPLQWFTFSAVKFGRVFKLISSDGSFVVEMGEDGYRPFSLDI